MTSINEHLVANLELNSENIYIEGVNILLKLLDNVIREPQNSKYRSIRVENLIIKEKLLALRGIKELLFDIGFEEVNDQLTLSSNVLVARLRKYREYINERLELVKSGKGGSTSAIPIPIKDIVKPLATVVVKAKRPFHQRTTFPRVLNTGNQFIQYLETVSDTVMQYEDAELQKSGLDLVPTEKLKLNALENMRKMQKLILSRKCDEEEPCFLDFQLVELAKWFKYDFFKWVNAMPCRVCGNENTTALETSSNNGIRVEKYFCCNSVTEFYRYNDIEMLLKTRSGRCGEWANCFTFFCRCLGYDARYVYSTEDHVWTEVFSVQKNRWVHVDPSENVIDSPLMYEHGWKKNISYIFAFSQDDVQDVTWRYSNAHKNVLTKRKSCSETVLLDTILKLRAKRQQNCSEPRKKYLKKRTFKELIELMKTREPTEDEKHGRSSGSLAWRLERGEQQVNNFYIFNLLPEEVAGREFNLKYSCSKDIYERNVKGNLLKSDKSWESCLFLSVNVFRKEEHDWKMVYLARTEGTNEALITWKFDFSKENLKVSNFDLKLETETYERAAIDILFFDENERKVSSPEGLSKFSLKVKMSGGKGDISWQHTQLFRQSKNSPEFPFELNIKF